MLQVVFLFCGCLGVTDIEVHALHGRMANIMAIINLNRCLTDDMQRPFGLGGLSFVKSV